jgi:hypothetical protein
MTAQALILYHKQATSARVRFARFGNTLLAATGEALPDATGVVGTHPVPLAAQAAARLGLAPGELRIDPEFRAELHAPDGAAAVWLAEFVAIDPPFEALAAAGGRFATLTELIGIPATERDVMRLVYEHILG